MTELILNICLALLPSIVILVLFHKFGPKLPFPKLIKPVIFGYIVVLPAIGINVLLNKLAPNIPFEFRLLFQAFIIAAFVEEIFKFSVIQFIKKSYSNAREIIIISILAGLGFALSENISYIFEGTETLLLRSLTAVPLHSMCAAISGFFIALRRSNNKSKPISGLLLAVLFHGLYDLLLMSNSYMSYLVILLLMVMFFIIRILFNYTKQIPSYF